ncbi:hypothetical protein PMAYCL1PPCAC_26228 [Pristionchus mayeri]|uniref:CUB domain-containing protein n=1 Tax=Pristionchus mayeri TaxID=1317129 RepID=A0AAN5D3S7_9BILA|nr:hypothetical protein PMAYCL1PPCAC_26228 [Pristionchus mayeri]
MTHNLPPKYPQSLLLLGSLLQLTFLCQPQPITPFTAPITPETDIVSITSDVTQSHVHVDTTGPNVLSDCPPVRIHGEAWVTSSGWPRGYPRNSSCWFFFSVNPKEHVKLKFEAVSINEVTDIITVKDGPFKNSTELGRVGNKPFDPYQYIEFHSTTNYMTVHFVSGAVRGGLGWTAHVYSSFT